MNFDIKTEQLSGDAYVISLTGEVDLYTAPEFKQQLLEVIGQGGKEVVVDFSGTTFIDSTTLGVLVGGVKRLRTNDGQLSLVCSDRNITKIFEITGLDKVFTIYPTREEAVSAIGSPARLRPGAPGRGLGGRARGSRAARDRLRHRRRRERRGSRPTRRTGRRSSQSNCGGCHTLAAAGTSGTIGPNLDDAFAADVKEGFRRARSRTPSSTRSGSARARSRRTRRASTSSSIACRRMPAQMPADIVKGQDAIDVAAYVASVAGTGRLHHDRVVATSVRTARRSSRDPGAPAATRSRRPGRPGRSARTSTSSSRRRPSS